MTSISVAAPIEQVPSNDKTESITLVPEIVQDSSKDDFDFKKLTNEDFTSSAKNMIDAAYQCQATVRLLTPVIADAYTFFQLFDKDLAVTMMPMTALSNLSSTFESTVKFLEFIQQESTRRAIDLGKYSSDSYKRYFSMYQQVKQQMMIMSDNGSSENLTSIVSQLVVESSKCQNTGALLNYIILQGANK